MGDLFSLIFISFFFISCSTDPVFVDERLQKEVFVFAVLDAAKPQQDIWIQIIRTGSSPQPVDHAQVTVTTEGQSFTFLPTQNGQYVESSGALPIVAQQRYQLNIEIPGFAPISSSMQMPDTPRFLLPGPADTLYLQKLSSSNPEYYQISQAMKWVDAAGALFYRIAVQISGSEKRSPILWSCLLPSSHYLMETSFYNLENGLQTSFSGRATLRILAFTRSLSYYLFLNPAGHCFDFNGAGWSDEQVQNFELALTDSFPDGRMNIRNARGVFGGVVSDSLILPVKIAEINQP